jgi:hypothetical protein
LKVRAFNFYEHLLPNLKFQLRTGLPRCAALILYMNGKYNKVDPNLMVAAAVAQCEDNLIARARRLNAERPGRRPRIGPIAERVNDAIYFTVSFTLCNPF